MSSPPDGTVPFDFPANFPRRSDFYSGDSSNNWNTKILYIAIISLSIVLVLVFALHLYARYVLRRQARRRAAIHHLSLAVARYSSGGDPPLNNTGLDPTVIASLPTFVFKRRNHDKSRNENDGDDNRRVDSSSSVMECSVCLSNLEDGEEARLLPNCKHVFHVACIDRWLESHSTCPICRTMARPVIEPRPREGPVAVALPLPAAPPAVEPTAEGTSEGGGAKINGSVSRLSSFRRMLSRERSSRRVQPSSSSISDDNIDRDLERQ